MESNINLKKYSKKNLLENFSLFLIIGNLVIISLAFSIIQKKSNIIRNKDDVEVGLKKKEYDKLKIYLIVSLAPIIIAFASSTAPFIKITTSFSSLLRIFIVLIIMAIGVTVTFLLFTVGLIPILAGFNPIDIGTNLYKYLEQLNSQEIYQKLKSKEGIINIIMGLGLLLSLIVLILVSIILNTILNNSSTKNIEGENYITLSKKTYDDIKIYTEVIFGLYIGSVVLLFLSKTSKLYFTPKN